MLREDACTNPNCQVKKLKTRTPCIACFGTANYCSEECRNDDYVGHHFECLKNQRKLLQGKGMIILRRQKQLGKNYGYDKLLAHIIKSIDKDVLLSSVFIIRCPDDPEVKFNKHYKVKRVDRKGLGKYMKHNMLFKKVYEQYLRFEVGMQKSKNIPHVYFVAYGPDMSFSVMTAIPFEEQQKFDEALKPHIEFIPCPCRLHSGQGEIDEEYLQKRE